MKSINHAVLFKNKNKYVDITMKFLQMGALKVLEVTFLFNLSLVRLQTAPWVQVWCQASTKTKIIGESPKKGSKNGELNPREN